MRSSFASFLWPRPERKEAGQKQEKGYLISLKKKPASLIKLRGTAFGQSGCTDKNAKRLPRPEEGSVFLPPDFGLIQPQWAVSGNLSNSEKIPCLLSAPHETDSTIASIPSVPKQN